MLCRSDSRGLEESIAANLDQLGVVVAALPVCDPFVVDRYVAGACLAGIAPLLIVNKLDLPGDAGDLSSSSRCAGSACRSTSFRHGREPACPNSSSALTGTRTLLAGQSGVGKSSLLNALAGDAIRAIGRLSERSGEGRHTTVSSAIIRQPWGELADSPGVRDYTPPVVPPQDVQRGFTEIARPLGRLQIPGLPPSSRTSVRGAGGSRRRCCRRAAL